MAVDMEEVLTRHGALARCLADIIQSHSGVKVFTEQEVPSLTRVVNAQKLNMLEWILSSTLTGQ